jgi:hypothetical protein
MCARRAWVRALGLIYPFFTLMVIIGTANHFIIDAVGGAVIITVGFAIQWLLSGRGAYTAPSDAPDFGMPDPPLPGRHPARPDAT